MGGSGMSTFRMTYRKNGVSQDYEYATERLWEVIERADKAFCRPETIEDRQRFAAILEKDAERRHPTPKAPSLKRRRGT